MGVGGTIYLAASTAGRPDTGRASPYLLSYVWGATRVLLTATIDQRRPCSCSSSLSRLAVKDQWDVPRSTAAREGGGGSTCKYLTEDIDKCRCKDPPVLCGHAPWIRITQTPKPLHLTSQPCGGFQGKEILQISHSRPLFTIQQGNSEA